MHRAVPCPKCRKSLKIPVSAAGKRIQCPGCSAVISVPASFGQHATSAHDDRSLSNAGSSPPSSPEKRSANSGTIGRRNEGPKPSKSVVAPSMKSLADDPRFRKRLIDSLQEPIEPVRTSMAYRLATLAVAVVMLVLPLLYLLMMVMVGWLVYYHLTHHQAMLTWSVGIRTRLFVILAYIAPLIIGAIVLFFMFKPLVAPPGRRPRTRSLTPEGEPLLFDYVTRLCEVVNAPVPSRIDIDAQLNASASFRGGILSLMGADLVLTIGTPLIAGLTLRQLTGVLAHEMGHFSQGMGMRLSFMIRLINLWFHRVVYERDQWDEWLAEAAADGESRLGWVFALAQGSVIISRAALWGLMLFGHLVSSALLRQMEYDADTYQARLVGRRTLGETLQRVQELGGGMAMAFLHLQVLCQKGIFPESIPDLMLLGLPQLASHPVKKSEGRLAERSLFHSHPSHEERIMHVAGETEEGSFACEGKGTDLFRYFPDMARGTTWDFYCSMLGARMKPSEMCATADIAKKVATSQPGPLSSRAAQEDLPPIRLD